jgi:heme O synthase-like polyprenyltransferase
MKNYAIFALGLVAIWWIRVAFNLHRDRNGSNAAPLALFIVFVISLVVLFPVAAVGGFL